jgi:hypothetical protein
MSTKLPGYTNKVQVKIVSSRAKILMVALRTRKWKKHYRQL